MADAQTVSFDDCWNRIGVRGDSSCERLVEYVRCLNCPVFETAAAKLLERPIPLVDLSQHDVRARAQPQQNAQGASESFLVFRIGDEWLALPTPIFKRIVQTRPIHTLPHRQHRAVLGVVNVQGELLVCLSLAHLLGFETGANARDDRARHDLPRFLVVSRAEEHAVFPVDQVDGVHRIATASFCAPPATLSHAAAAHTRAVAPWRGMSVGLLDADALFDTLNRSLG
ncbi:chemotaxis-related protein WspD [Paraburkholderia sp. BL18I3N2]|uniref:chemotaxis protein CheW n=1 Tax=Paraburkholderia sp. BL18I3N2 TaxID=1938799 RepID=UPI000D06BC2A|nr:chemotaxis protein CheW [Paraburkholderia sp. BL18I3N2]PRX34418.1 chemotaxis-related protein WspD [Paraburkholderia sp. BL18I3N2]